ncbi:MAG: Rieske (2Fe-2S) protein [Bacteroidetes bacterium]|nr:Rieske (2Fe-2S) protein [Bacteroidota bacterium]
MDRKEFIKTCCLAGLGTTALSAVLQGCAASNYYAKTIAANNVITIGKSEFVQVKKDKTILRKYVLVKVDKFNFPICIYNLDQQKYSAILMECTHNSCELRPQGNYVVCPCHGSEFSNTGIVQNPPAEKNLQTLHITSDNENIYLHL